MLKQIDTKEWAEVFSRNESEDGQIRGCLQRKDIKEIAGICDGEPGKSAWLMVGKVLDGRFFLFEGKCSAEGWEKGRGFGGTDWADNFPEIRETLTQHGMQRLGL